MRLRLLVPDIFASSGIHSSLNSRVTIFSFFEFGYSFGSVRQNFD